MHGPIAPQSEWTSSRAHSDAIWQESSPRHVCMRDDERGERGDVSERSDSSELAIAGTLNSSKGTTAAAKGAGADAWSFEPLSLLPLLAES